MSTDDGTDLGAPLGPDRRRLLGLGLGGHGALPFRRGRLRRGLLLGPHHESPALQPAGRRREADAAAAAAARRGHARGQHEPRGGRRHVGARHGLARALALLLTCLSSSRWMERE
jgi:hypothetical protein